MWLLRGSPLNTPFDFVIYIARPECSIFERISTWNNRYLQKKLNQLNKDFLKINLNPVTLIWKIGIAYMFLHIHQIRFVCIPQQIEISNPL